MTRSVKKRDTPYVCYQGGRMAESVCAYVAVPLILGDFMSVFDLRRVVCRQDIAETRNDNYQAVVVEETNILS